MPAVRCEICGSSLVHKPGQASEVLTTHYAQEHPKVTADAAPAEV
jgi:hypothetical protein